jgi:hypothetical protein
MLISNGNVPIKLNTLMTSGFQTIRHGSSNLRRYALYLKDVAKSARIMTDVINIVQSVIKR